MSAIQLFLNTSSGPGSKMGLFTYSKGVKVSKYLG